MSAPPSTVMSFPLFRLAKSGSVSAELVLLLERRNATLPHRQRFRIDTGADISIIPGHLEEELNLDYPGAWRTIEMTTAVGKVSKRIVLGRCRACIPGLGDEEFEWPCIFDEDNLDRYLLGMAGVINGTDKRLKITLDGTPHGVSFPAGRLIVEVVRS